MLQGDPATALLQPGSVVVTGEPAKKYFGSDWQTARLPGQALQIEDKPYLITGVLQDLPTHTDLQFTALLTFELTPDQQQDWLDPATIPFCNSRTVTKRKVLPTS